MIARLTPAERKAARRYATTISRHREPSGAPAYCLPGSTPPEPALGTLDERLDILIRRHGGHAGPVRLTPDERRLVAACKEA